MVHYGKRVSMQLRLGDFLRKSLYERGITQEQFAEQICVDPRTVGRWIRDGIDKISVVENIAQVLQIPVEDIFHEVEDVLFYAHF